MKIDRSFKMEPVNFTEIKALMAANYFHQQLVE